MAAGENFIDTANVYQNEESEKRLGEWMSSRNNKKSMVVATKYGSSYKIYNRDKYGCQRTWGGAGTKSMKKSLEESLEKFQTEYVDLLFLHWWDYATSIQEIIIRSTTSSSLGRCITLGFQTHLLG